MSRRHSKSDCYSLLTLLLFEAPCDLDSRTFNPKPRARPKYNANTDVLMNSTASGPVAQTNPGQAQVDLSQERDQ
jgi:hypothetical protein